ncbi:MAG TPA: carbon-nitrogen hydrolase family protein [Candidatus Acidoferrum sp.]|nr:carbon-nitrogen hydrolase family protein [Candidatus Acidoferrum sp.]
MIRLAALQLRAHDRDHYERLRGSLFERIERAARDCDLLVLPEGTFPAYVLGDSTVDERLVGSVSAELSRIARKATCVIVAGAAARRGSALHNSALVIDRDGSVAGSADKLFLWHFDRRWFAPGASIAPVDTSLGSLGVLICADGRMPGIARALVDRGAELLVMPTAWVTSGRDPHTLENLQADLLGRVRAFENGVPFIAANKCGVELNMVAYCGKSQIVSASGDVVALASQTDEELVSAHLELQTPAPHRCTKPNPAARTSQPGRALRIAIERTNLPADIGARLRILENDFALAATGDDDFAALDATIPAVRLDANDAFDPGVLAEYRLAGYRVAVLDAHTSHPWLERIARARAAELRMYVIVFEGPQRRAFAVDPDGAVIAGTFDDFTIASFSLDPQRTAQTLVAPGTDVAAGIEFVQSLSPRETSAM